MGGALQCSLINEKQARLINCWDLRIDNCFVKIRRIKSEKSILLPSPPNNLITTVFNDSKPSHHPPIPSFDRQWHLTFKPTVTDYIYIWFPLPHTFKNGCVYMPYTQIEVNIPQIDNSVILWLLNWLKPTQWWEEQSGHHVCFLSVEKPPSWTCHHINLSPQKEHSDVSEWSVFHCTGHLSSTLSHSQLLIKHVLMFRTSERGSDYAWNM